MTLRVAIAGAGYIANIHAKAVLTQGGALVAVVGRPTERTDAFARTHLIEKQYPTVEALVADGNVDALVVCTPNALHRPQTIAALHAGIHVLVEKPMAMNAPEAEEMLEASFDSGARLMVAHCWRFDSDVLWLREQVSRLGTIVRTKAYGVHSHWGPSGWFTDTALAGGGALADMGIHALDTTRFLLGDPAPVSVYARIGTYYHPGDLDDTGVLLVEWDNGVTSYIESGWWQPHADGPEAATQLYGTQGFGQLFPTRLKVPGRERKPELISSGLPFPRAEHCPQSMYDAQMGAFFSAIRDDRIPVPGAVEGLTNMKVVDAAYESSRSGQVVLI